MIRLGSKRKKKTNKNFIHQTPSQNIFINYMFQKKIKKTQKSGELFKRVYKNNMRYFWKI